MSSKVLLHLSATQKPVPKAAVPARDMTFGSLSLRLHLPYWFIHQGNCEHFVVFDEIRWENLRFTSKRTLSVFV